MKRITNFMFLTLMGMAAFSLTAGNSVADVKGNDLVVTIDVDQLPLKDVLAEISSQTKWNIAVDEKLVDKPIAGNFNNIGLDSFLKRTLRNENLIVFYDEGSKTVDIRSFGGTGKMMIIKANPLPDNPDDAKRIQALRLEEQRAYDAYISNPNSIEPLTGMTLGEIAALHEAEQKAYDEFMSNPESIDPITGMKLGQVAAMHKAEQKAYDEFMSNPESIDPITGMKLGEVAAMRETEQKAYKLFMSNPESIDPITGMTLAKVAALRHEEQREADKEGRSQHLSTPIKRPAGNYKPQLN